MLMNANGIEPFEPEYATFAAMIRHLAERFGERECMALGDDRPSLAAA
jgi:hypothetical protein